jgi:RNA polymerase sigma factor (sigma-70 family)
MTANPMRKFLDLLRGTALLQEGKEQSDGQLLTRFVEDRDPLALETLVRRHAAMVWSVCRRNLTRQQDAEDAFQATFLVLLRKAASLRAPELLANWLYGVAYQTSRKLRQTAAKRPVPVPAPEPSIVAPDDAFGPELLSQLDRELSRLPEKYRSAIVLCHLEGKSLRDAAALMRVAEGTVGSRLARGREMLARRLVRSGATVSATSAAAVLTAQAASAAVPATLLGNTLNAATLLASGETVTAGLLSAEACRLSEGVLHTLRMARCKAAGLVLLVTMLVLGVGIVAYHMVAVGQRDTETPAPPPVLQVQVPWPGGSTQEMERLVTLPLEVTLAGMPGLKTTLSRSMVGLTQIDLYFDDTIDFDKARQEVIERLSKGPKLPEGAKATVTASRQFTVEILRYTLVNPKDARGHEIYTLADLRALQDEILTPELRRLPGATVVSAGGAAKRYEIQLDPERMKRYGISREQLAGRVAESSGGVKDPMPIALQKKTPKDAAAYLREQEQIHCRHLRNLVITSINNIPIRIDDVVSGGPVPAHEARSVQGVIVGQKKQHSKVSMDQAPAAANKAWRSQDDIVEGIIRVRKDADAAAIRAKALAKVKEFNAAAGRLLPGVKMELVPAGERFFVEGNFPADSSLASASEVVSKARKLLREFPEVQTCLSQIGPESEGLPLHSAEICIMLKPAQEWPAGPGLDRPRTLAELKRAVVDRLRREHLGPEWTSSLTSAAETPPLAPGPGEFVVKVIGPDLDKLHALAASIEQRLAKVKGVDQLRRYVGRGQTGIEFIVDKEKCGRLGLKPADVSEAIAAALREKYEGEKDAAVIACWPRRRADEGSLLEILLDLGNPGFGIPARVPIKDLVTPVGPDGRPDLKGQFPRLGAVTIYREDGKRLVALRFRVHGRAVADVQKEAEIAIVGVVPAPFRVVWAGRQEERP